MTKSSANVFMIFRTVYRPLIDRTGITVRLRCPKILPSVPSAIFLICGSLFGQVDSSRPISTVTGGAPGFAGDGGAAAAGQFYFDEVFTIRALAMDSAGNLLIADTSNRRICRLTSDGRLPTLAGSAIGGFGGDGGPATTTSLDNPGSIAIDPQGRVTIGDSENYRVRRINGDATIQTIAGGGSQPLSRLGLLSLLGPVSALDLRLDVIRDVAVDPQGRVYVYSTSQSSGIGFRIDTSGRAESVCCPGVFDTQGSLYNWSGGRILKNGRSYPNASSDFGRIGSIALDKQGNLYVAENSARMIKRIGANGAVTTVAGIGREALGDLADGNGGNAENAKLGVVNGMVVDPSGNLYFSEMV